MTDTILVVNAGSSSIKFQLFDLQLIDCGDDALPARLRGQIEGIGTHPRLAVKGGETLPLPAEAEGVPGALAFLGAWLREHAGGGGLPVAIGHRVVHGGPAFDTHVVVDEAVIATLETYIPLAPLHQPNNLAPIRAIRRIMPDVVQVACFDTAFHRQHPELADRYALPDQFYQDGVRRYGFHGLSYEYIARRLADVAPEVAQGRVVVAHLGSGASMCAIQAGRSVDSTMGFTAMDGLPMGTRPGQLDPGVVLYLMDRGMDARAIEHLLYHDCGLKGLSGISNDVRDLLASDDPRARLALDYFVYRAGLAVGSLAAAMGGIDALVFTAGIGERAPSIRQGIAERARWLGLDLDDAANEAGESRISTPGSRVKAYVVPTDEERMIALHTRDILGRHRQGRHH
ncbi:acetate/propionate family kinase [Azospirillum rugosum]|uniref:Acetate kinase n=1 Tax=Azospirillum rugosum TaxID=416170 RepID=A0ABS4STD2_9PROT|nr:acetate/propionate family kinase [Azospirillum rugosum]MBP2295809.1 acetate kinase [Azospirillum rugosum]MDQ0529080.1 acetate kinase [Azospirillum rugosum]